MICPECSGAGRILATGFVCGPVGRCGQVEIRCHACKGSGKVDPRTPHWRDLGAQLKALRVKGDHSGREFAAILQITALRLADAEHGRIDPEPFISRAERILPRAR